MRKSYGNTWWGKQWLNALNNIDNSNRLPRGKTYANKGTVSDIKIVANKITAKVQGSRRTPYKVSFTISKFSADEKATIIKIITSNPLFLSKLLNRKLPSELYDYCNRKNIRIFSRNWDDMQGNCSCPDWAVPCKHMAATLFIVANEIDKNPFLVFQLHDFDLFKGLEGIGYTAAVESEINIPLSSNLKEAFSFENPTKTWDKNTYEQLDFSQLPDCKEDLLTILGNNPVFFPNGDFKVILNKVYTAVSKQLIKRKKTIYKEEAATIEVDAIEEIEILLDAEFDFLQCTARDSRGKSCIELTDETALIEWIEQIPMAQFNQLSVHLRGLYLAYQFAYQLAIHSAYIPQLLRINAKAYKIRWIPALLNPKIKAVYDQITSILPSDILFYKNAKDILQPKAHDAPIALLSLFLTHFINNYHKLKYDTLQYKISALFFASNLGRFLTFEEKNYPTAIQLWLNKFFITDKDFVPVIIVEDEADEFQITIAVDDKNKPLEAPIPLDKLLEEDTYKYMRLDALRDFALLSDYFPAISRLVASKGKEKLHFNPDEFVSILFKILPTIRLFGIKILLPKALQKLMRPQVSMVMDSEEEESGVVKKESLINMESMLRFQWKIAIGDELLDSAAFLKMVKKFSGIVKLNDQYVFFDEKEIASLIQKLENPPELNSNQLLQIALAEEYKGAKVQLNKKTKALMKRLLKSEETTLPQGLKATLRPYQLSGYEWLYKNSRIGFGSLIADDMGLGKTLQVIATLLKLKEDGELTKEKALIIVPTTLLTNWDKEIQKFAPDLKTHVYHGSNRKIEGLKEADALITTYGIARSEAATMKKQKWKVVIIDEAQNIKNPSTAQTKAIKKIKASVKIAMSGTPVENRLSEYWSIFDFTNKGYLNTLSKFKDNFARPIEIDRDQTQLNRFRKITAPFILRRLKSDKSIIKDLPDKIEKDQFCSLTPQQAAVYQNVVDQTMNTIENAEGIARRGMILKLITGLKQICNHPTQFLKKGMPDPQLSGKSILLFNLISEILNNGEKTLIFTQYQEMGKMLVKMLEKEFNLEIPFLHGGVSRKGRDEMVQNLQNDRATRIMILSLKAGGTGLNLTKANNIIHYDLWWNPAVEAQATDRAYRIGQTKNVMVHRFITQNTFEEKINKLLLEKKELANLTVSTGEKWIGEFSNSELRELVKLG